MKILLSNDDSVNARGIKVLYDVLKKIADVTVVAPLEEKSTTGHSLTIHKPLRVVPSFHGFYGVNGSPADCIHVGVEQVLKSKPDIIVSGINRGANLGQDVYYSGTVSAAREACIMGIPSIAVSLFIDFKKRKPEEALHYESAAKLCVQVIRLFQQKNKIKMPKHTLMNLNVPDLPLSKIKGVSLAKQGFRHYSTEIIKRRDHRGKDYFWVGGGYLGFRDEEGTDCNTVDKGYAALTPLTLDTTNHQHLVELMERFGNGVVIK